MNAPTPSSLFGQAKHEITYMMPLAQQDASPTVNAFAGAAQNNNNKPQEPSYTAAVTSAGMTNDDKLRLANDVHGLTLRDPGQGIYLPPQGPHKQSMAGELGNQMAQLGSEVGKKVWEVGGEAIKAFSSVFSLGDPDGNGIPGDQRGQSVQVAAAPAAPPPQYGLPSPSGGMGG